MDSASPQDNGREESREDNESKGETTQPTSDDNEGTDTESSAWTSEEKGFRTKDGGIMAKVTICNLPSKPENVCVKRVLIITERPWEPTRLKEQNRHTNGKG